MRYLSTITLLPATLLLAILVIRCAPETAETTLHGRTMGTTWTVRIVGCASADCSGLQAQLDARLAELSNHLSHYDPRTELSDFNQQRNTEWFSASVELATVVEAALRVSAESDGAFDITIAPAVEAWGFGPAEQTGQRPASADLDFARTHSGYRKLELRDDQRALRKLDPQLRLDLSAIAPGYAVDQLAYLLESRGLTNFLVEIGGEVRTAGVRPDGKSWRIGIESPVAGLPIEYVVMPGDAAVATSGNYRDFYVLDGKKIAHTIDPLTALPADNGLESVSVIAPSAMQADAYATAIMVMGPEAGLAFAERLNLPALLMLSDSDKPALRSSKFDSYLAK